jgi:small subunit ribosomal protein S8
VKDVEDLEHILDNMALIFADNVSDKSLQRSVLKNIVKMSQDIVADALNTIMNNKSLEKKEVMIKKVSKLLVRILEMMKKDGHVDFEIIGDKKKIAIVKINKLNESRAIKPRYSVEVSEINKYERRFLPSRNFGKLIISTSKGLMSQKEAYEKNIGGCLIAYYY